MQYHNFCLASCHWNHFRSLIKIVLTCAVASDLASSEMGWSSLSWRTVGGESRWTFSPFWCGHDRSRRHTRHHHQSRLKWNNVRIFNEHGKSTIRRQKKLHIVMEIVPDSPLPLEELPLFALFLGVSVARLLAKAPSSTTVRTVVVAELFKSPRCRKQLNKKLKIQIKIP